MKNRKSVVADMGLLMAAILAGNSSKSNPPPDTSRNGWNVDEYGIEIRDYYKVAHKLVEILEPHLRLNQPPFKLYWGLSDNISVQPSGELEPVDLSICMDNAISGWSFTTYEVKVTDYDKLLYTHLPESFKLEAVSIINTFIRDKIIVGPINENSTINYTSVVKRADNVLLKLSRVINKDKAANKFCRLYRNTHNSKKG